MWWDIMRYAVMWLVDDEDDDVNGWPNYSLTVPCLESSKNTGQQSNQNFLVCRFKFLVTLLNPENIMDKVII